MMTARLMLVSAGVLASAVSCLAHAFWLQPSSFRPGAGTPVTIELRVGDEFPGDAVPRNDEKLRRFVSIGSGSGAEMPIAGRDGRSPAGYVRLESAGTAVIAFENEPSRVELPREKFVSYLREEGLEKIVERVPTDGDGVQKELYSRCAKAIVNVDGRGGAGFDRVVGMMLEIVPLVDPAGLKPGDELRVRVLFGGKPLEGALVHVGSPGVKEHITGPRTDGDGVASVRVPSAGMWVLDTVEMVDAPAESGARWRSYWASLSFEVEASPGGAAR